MNNISGTILLTASAFICVLTMLSAFVRPAQFADLLGLTVANSGGRSEIRSQYAGFFLAVGIACIAALLGVLPRQIGYVLNLVVYGGLLIGRVASLGLNGGTSGYPPTIPVLLALELLGTGLAVFVLWPHPAA